jgi:osmotically-inducible protein OsmY
MNLRKRAWIAQAPLAAVWIAAAVIGLSLCTATAFAQESRSAPADNTRTNVRDRNPNEPTADSQRTNMSDRDITRQIRQSLAKDNSLSSYAHNVKVVTQNGQVTLKGPVRSEEEKRAVEEKAAAVAGQDKVNSELDIKEKR